MAARINVPCKGNGGSHSVSKIPDEITIGTSGNCRFTSLQFVPVEPPAGFSNRQPATGGGATISYDYDGRPIPAGGYTFQYVTDAPMEGNGTGVIKN